PVAAEPYLAVRTGLKCSACHINRTGGGGRNDYGALFGQTQLPLTAGTAVSRRLGDVFAAGFDLRASASGFFEDVDPRTSMDLDEAQAYVEARLLDRALAFYLDQTVGPNRSASREIFAMLERLPLNGYAKVGKLLPPYGLRLKDDFEFVRDRTGFTFATPDLGIELGIEPGPVQVVLAVTNGEQGGVESNSGKQVTSTAQVVTRYVRLGASASRNESAARRDVVGGFGGVGMGPLALLGEVDLIRDRTPTGTLERLAGFVEGDWLVTRGVNAKVTYGYFDRNLDVDEDHRYRMRFGLEVFPRAFVQVSGFYILEENIPQATDDLDRALLELRLFF
ncbi:MAG TPA: hypothetical protein VFH97_08365, partial [Gemmatimonadales bacterium]|nr:hypothetical protein [Gemmatimonadales bacterium]